MPFTSRNPPPPPAAFPTLQSVQPSQPEPVEDVEEPASLQSHQNGRQSSPPPVNSAAHASTNHALPLRPIQTVSLPHVSLWTSPDSHAMRQYRKPIPLENRSINWGEIPPILRLSIVRAITVQNTPLPTAFHMLGLDQAQQALYHHHESQLASALQEEDATLRALQKQVTASILHDNSMTVNRYHELVNTYLHGPVRSNASNEQLITFRDLRRASEFLSSRGLSLSLLADWSAPQPGLATTLFVRPPLPPEPATPPPKAKRGRPKKAERKSLPVEVRNSRKSASKEDVHENEGETTESYSDKEDILDGRKRNRFQPSKVPVPKKIGSRVKFVRRSVDDNGQQRPGPLEIIANGPNVAEQQVTEAHGSTNGSQQGLNQAPAGPRAPQGPTVFRYDTGTEVPGRSYMHSPYPPFGLWTSRTDINSKQPPRVVPTSLSLQKGYTTTAQGAKMPSPRLLPTTTLQPRPIFPAPASSSPPNETNAALERMRRESMRHSSGSTAHQGQDVLQLAQGMREAVRSVTSPPQANANLTHQAVIPVRRRASLAATPLNQVEPSGALTAHADGVGAIETCAPVYLNGNHPVSTFASQSLDGRTKKLETPCAIMGSKAPRPLPNNDSSAKPGNPAAPQSAEKPSSRAAFNSSKRKRGVKRAAKERSPPGSVENSPTNKRLSLRKGRLAKDPRKIRSQGNLVATTPLSDSNTVVVARNTSKDAGEETIAARTRRSRRSDEATRTPERLRDLRGEKNDAPTAGRGGQKCKSSAN